MTTATPQPLNTHHLWKLVALVFMTVDHVGAFWFPEELWWRAVGRVFVPIWFFLVGHALRYEPRGDTLLWALVLAVLNPFLGLTAFPLNTLMTILGIQCVLQRVEAQQLLARNPLVLVLIAILFLLPSLFLLEYGTLALLFALLGYARRSGQMSLLRGGVMAVAAYGMYVGMMLVSFAFTVPQALVVISGTAVMVLLMLRFEHRPMNCPRMLTVPLRFVAQHSLQYYVLHRVLMQVVGVLRGTLVHGFRWL